MPRLRVVLGLLRALRGAVVRLAGLGLRWQQAPRAHVSLLQRCKRIASDMLSLQVRGPAV